MSRHLILASRSPRRRQLLEEAGYAPIVMPPLSAEESGKRAEETPAEYVMRLAEEKADDVLGQLAAEPPQLDARWLVACDTVAHLDGEILGKPADAKHAGQMLRTLRGREHEVLTGLALVRLADRGRQSRVAVTRLQMDKLSDAAIDEYVASGQWEGKAGGFGFQDRLGWIHILEGSASNVVGLPLELLAGMLADDGAPK